MLGVLELSQIKTFHTNIDGLVVVEPTVHGDQRGYFCETYNRRDFFEAGLTCEFIQDNQSMSRQGVLRGLHFQLRHPQAKLVRVISGEVFDVAVDLRLGSATYGKWYGVKLSGENQKQFYIPEGFAHGYLVLSETAVFAYKVTDYWYPGDEGGIAWNDPALAIDWPGVVGTYGGSASGEGYRLASGGALTLSDKDRQWGLLQDLGRERT